jgi:hypothetical protein
VIVIERVNVVDSVWIDDTESNQDDDERTEHEENCERNFEKNLQNCKRNFEKKFQNCKRPQDGMGGPQS